MSGGLQVFDVQERIIARVPKILADGFSVVGDKGGFHVFLQSSNT